MPEQQNIEWKTSWRDEYLKWICGFANAKGGKIFIGKDDNGNVVGVENFEKLMDEIPNKILNLLGIICDVNLCHENDKYYIEIEVESYPYAVNYKGQYHYRSGSTKQELKGAALDRFLLKKQGKCWDSVLVSQISINKLNEKTLQLFRKKAINSKRLSEEILADDDNLLIEKLNLIENNYLKRAAILLFFSNPEKFISGAFVKIGYFQTDDDLRFQDEIHGNLFEQIEQTLILLKTKYLKAFISYKGIERIEEYIFPESAIREALLNAICHKDYGSNTPIQISVYENKIIFWNCGQLPENWTIEKLTIKHPSKPFNPDIANTLFWAGYIEAWGRGTIKMINECKKAGKLPPLFKYDFSGFIVEFYAHSETELKNKGLKDWQIKIILFIQEKGAISNSQIQKLCKVSKRTASTYLSDLEGLYLEKTGTTGKGTSYTLKGQ
jgi:ATP-dependent DNA helicase RecG